MKQLVAVTGVQGITKHMEGTEMFIAFQVGAKHYRRKVCFKPFSNFPIEFVFYKGVRYQVNNVSV